MRPLATLAVLSLSGCAAMLPAPVPMASVQSLREAGPGRCLLVMLPGRGDRAQDFAAKGFLEAIQKRPRLSVDAVAADAVFGYYARRTLFERLETDVLAPLKARGNDQVWLLGISMGGLGTLLEAKNRSGWAGAILLAPFLGEAELVAEIERAGGPAKWEPGKVDPDDYQRELWAWLKGALPRDEPRITLAYGEQDRMAAQQRVLAAALPEGRVFRAPGGHDWATWTRLFDEVLDRSDFARACAASAAP